MPDTTTDLPEEPPVPVTLLVPNQLWDLLNDACLYLKPYNPDVSPETLLLQLAQQTVQRIEEEDKKLRVPFGLSLVYLYY